MMESCDNCAKDMVSCSYQRESMSGFSCCSAWEPIAAIPEWVSKKHKSYGTDFRVVKDRLLVEEGYNQAMQDIEEWWSGDESGIILEAWVSRETTELFDSFRQILRDKKKERFHPEPKPELDDYQRCLDNIKKLWSDKDFVRMVDITALYQELKDKK